jgi:hypothetical protein
MKLIELWYVFENNFIHSPNAISKILKRLGIPSRRAQQPTLRVADIKSVIEVNFLD